MIQESIRKIKGFLDSNRQDLYIAVLIFLVGLASFGLGRLSMLWPQKTPLVIEGPAEAVAVPKITTVEDRNYVSAVSGQGKYVASKSGSAYHLPSCAGAQKIKEENKIWFQTKEEAESRGYKPAANCDGL